MPMIRTLLLATAALGLAAYLPAHAAPPCKTATGKIVKCSAKPGAKKMAAHPAMQAVIAKKKVKPRVTDTTGRVSYKW
jgi:hypothetical protein